MINSIKNKLSMFKRNIIWLENSHSLKYKLKRRNDFINIINDTLILIPHSDDEWVGCGQLIMQKYDQVSLCYMNMNGGDTKEVHSKRYNELETTAKKFTLPLYILEGHFDEKYKQLAKLIELKKPQNIAVPFYCDWHDEHIEVMKILKNALFMIEDISKLNIIMYQVSVPIPLSIVTTCIKMDKKMQQRKWDFFYKTYKTQNYIPWKRFQLNEYINGAITGSYAAEVFVIEEASKWISLLDSRIFSEKEREIVLNNINNLKEIRNIVNEIIR